MKPFVKKTTNVAYFQAYRDSAGSVDARFSLKEDATSQKIKLRPLYCIA